MLGLRKKLVASVATLAMVGLPLATGGAAFAATTSGSTSTGSSSTSNSSTSSSSTSSTSSSTSSTSTSNGAGYTNVSFSDVTTSTPHYNSIEELAALGLVNGFPDGTYQPKANVTRAEFAKLIDVALGLQSAASGDTGTSNFSDVPAGQWYTGYVNVAAAKGIINGYPDGTFKPNSPVTYDEAVTMVVRALGYEPNVVGPWPSGYMAEAANIQNSAKQYTLLSGLSDQLSQTMDRADVARLMDNMLYAVPASQQFKLTNGNTQVTTSAPTAATQAAQLGFNLYYPGNSQASPPLSSCYGNVVTGTILTNPALNPNQVQITSLKSSSCGNSPVVAAGTANTYTLAPTVAIVGSTNVINLTGYQVSFATNNQGQIVYIGSVTPKNDALAGASLGSTLNITNTNGVGQLPTGVSQISVEPSGASAYQSYDVASGAIAVPTSGTFNGSNGSNDAVTAILNPNGDIVSLIDTDRLTQYKDVYLLGLTTLNGSQTLKFYDGSLTPTNLGIAPGASVTIDGSPASLTDLKHGMVLNISINSQSQATSIQASDKTVTGTISNVTIQTTGTTYLTVNGTEYKIRTGSAILAQAGQAVSPAKSTSTLDGLVNDSGTVSIGVDNHIGFINVTNSNTIVGLALSGVVNGAVEVEGANGQVVAYPVPSTTTNVKAGDIVRITLNPAGGNATISNYTENSTASINAGSALAPAEVLGVLGSELQFMTPGGAVVDAYMSSHTPVFQGTSGGGYSLTNLKADATASTTAIATTAGTTTPATLSPGDLITIGVTGSGVVKGVLYLNNDTGSSITVGTKSVNGATLANGTVDVLVPTASTATSGQLGTANVVPMGSTTPIGVSVESLQSGTTVNQNLGTDAGTNQSAFQLSLLGQSLIQSSLVLPSGSAVNSSLTTMPSALSGGGAAGVYYCGLTSSGASFYTSANSDCSGETSVSYGGGTVVLNVPNDQVEPVGSLIQGQQIYVFSEQIPNAVVNTTSTTAEFIEVVNTATNVASTTTSSGSVTVNISDTGTTVSNSTYGSIEEYAVTGTVPGSSTQVPAVIVSATSSGPAYFSSSYVSGGSAAPTATSASATVPSSGTSYSAYVFVPKGSNLTTDVKVVAVGGTSSSASGTGSVVTP